MHAVRTLQAIVIATFLLAASAASSATDTPAVASSNPVPKVVIIAKRPTMPEKIRMTLEDLRDAAKRLAGMQQKDSAPAASLG